MGLVLFGTSLSCVLFQIGPLELCLRSDGDDASTARAPESSSAVTVLAQQVLSIAWLSTASNSGSQASCSHVHVGAGPRTANLARNRWCCREAQRPYSRGFLRRWVNNEELFILSS